jgi:hypothetical protein
MRNLLIFFCSSFYGQVLHHQMLSPQRKTAVLANGTTIGSIVLQIILKMEMLFSKDFNKTLGLNTFRVQ